MEKKTVRKRVTFKLRAPGASEVFVAGSFNDWSVNSTPLKEDGNAGEGMWQRMVYLEPGEYQYRFIVDGSWCDDPLCFERWVNEFGTENSVLSVKGEAPKEPKKGTRRKA